MLRQRDATVPFAQPYLPICATGCCASGTPRGLLIKGLILLSLNGSPNVSLLYPHKQSGGGEVIREREVPTLASRRMQRGRPEPFLRGPIPVHLIGMVLDLPGRPLPVWLAIWHRVALTGKPWVSLPATVMADFRFTRTAK